MTKARDLSAFVSQGVSTTELSYLDGVTSAVQTQLNQKPEVVAGKNFVANGGFDVWQRGTSFTGITNDKYYADQWILITDGIGNINISRQDIASSGIGVQYAMRMEKTSGNSNRVVAINMTEGALNCVGKRVTFSFYLRKGSGLTSDAFYTCTTRANKYGTSYDGQSGTISNSSLSSSAFTRFSYSFDVTTTTSTNNAQYFEIEFNFIQAGGANVYLDIAAVQIEISPSVTQFSRAGGTIQGELALCQRYYWRFISDTIYQAFGYALWEPSSGIALGFIDHPVIMRTVPTSIDVLGPLMLYDGAGAIAINSITIGSFSSRKRSRINITPASTPTTYRPYEILSNGQTAPYIGFSAEL
jgi:hypothetical protein